MNTQPFWTGFVVAVIGFFSSFPIYLAGVTAMGADDAQAASALMAGALSMGLAGIILSLWLRIPSSVAWSTSGVALLAISQPDPQGFAAAVGAFIFGGALTIVAGLWRPLGQFARAIPPALTQAMLAGILFSICLVPFQALGTDPEVALPILLTWFIVGRIKRLFAVPAAVLMAFVLLLIHTGGAIPVPDTVLTTPVFTMPVFTLNALIGIGLPLFIVNMATQNIPGASVIKTFGYEPDTRRMFGTVGVFSVVLAPFGSASTCIAAITAAMCSGEDAHPDPAKRYLAAVWAGSFYCAFGLFAGFVTYVASSAPSATLPVLAGVALIAVFVNSTAIAWKEEETREAAAVTFLITASGVTIFGFGGAVWGLLAGGAIYLIQERLKS